MAVGEGDEVSIGARVVRGGAGVEVSDDDIWRC